MPESEFEMKTAIVSMCTRNILPYAQYTITLNRAYSEKHDIPLFYYMDVLETTRHPVWSKLLALRNHVMDFDWLLWIDADAAIVNHEKTIEPLVDGVDKMILIGKDINGWNAGVFILKGGQESKDWLEFVFRQTQFIKSKYKEQDAMSWSFTLPQYQDRVMEINRKLINAYWTQKHVDYYTDGDFILHTPGTSDTDRIAIFKPFVDKLMEKEGNHAVCK